MISWFYRFSTKKIVTKLDYLILITHDFILHIIVGLRVISMKSFVSAHVILIIMMFLRTNSFMLVVEDACLFMPNAHCAVHYALLSAGCLCR